MLSNCCVYHVQQNVRMGRYAAFSDGQGDWLDVQTLYASDRYTDQSRSRPQAGRECLFIHCIYFIVSDHAALNFWYVICVCYILKNLQLMPVSHIQKILVM